MRLASLTAVGLLALAFLACSVKAPAADDATSSEDSLRALSPAEILGEIHYGETKGPFAYTRRPRLRGFWFQGSSGDEIDVKATSTAGAATVLVADEAVSSPPAPGAGTLHDLPGGSHTTLTKTGKYWIAVRDSQLADAQLTVTLTRTNTASQTIADVAVGPYGTCALLGGAGGVRCWGLTASDYFTYANFNSATSKTPANAMPASHHFLPSHRKLAFDGAPGGGSWQTALESAQNNYGTPLVYGEAFFKSLDPADPAARPLALLSDECAWFAGRIRCTSGYSSYSIKDFDFGGETFLAGAVGSTRSFACAITPARTLKCWGGNAYGRLGTGDNLSRGVGDPDQDAHADLTLLAPVNLGAGATVTSAALGDNHACALLTNGTVKCWGAGSKGQLGRVVAGNVGVLPGDMGDALPVVALGGAGGGGVAASAKGVFAFDDATCIALADGHVRCFGVLPYPLVSEMVFDKPVKKLVVSGTGTQYAADAQHACALLEDGSLRCWGSNTFGALGLPSAITTLTYDANVGAASLVAIAVP